MAQRDLLKMGNPRLNEISTILIDRHSKETQNLITDMLETMLAANGAGIAAPQLGVLSRVIVFGINQNPRYPEIEPIPQTVLINPEIEILDEEMVFAWEGCLSVPGMRGLVPRYKKIRYSAYDQLGTKRKVVAEDFHARVVQHEIDHLEGILYPQRIKDLTKFGFIDELEKTGVIPTITKTESG